MPLCNWEREGLLGEKADVLKHKNDERETTCSKTVWCIQQIVDA
jgi:hypothetical protein